MSLQIRVTRNSVSPTLSRLAKGITDRRPILQAMGLQLVSMTKRAFNDSALRAAPWPNKRDGTASRLKKSGALWQSIRITAVTNAAVTVGSDRPYAAVHQLGSSKATGRGSGIPARPFFPFLGGVMLSTARAKMRSVAEAKIRALAKST